VYGVIPPQDCDELYKDGDVAIFGPGTAIPAASLKILKILECQGGTAANGVRYETRMKLFRVERTETSTQLSSMDYFPRTQRIARAEVFLSKILASVANHAPTR
jgi:hypothetical protein